MPRSHRAMRSVSILASAREHPRSAAPRGRQPQARHQRTPASIRISSRAGRLCAALAPEGVLIAYGHAGDGNLHFNLNQGATVARQAFLDREQPLKRALHDLAHEFGGSCSAEHASAIEGGGIATLCATGGARAMHRIKHALDPHGILNPGKYCSAHAAAYHLHSRCYHGDTDAHWPDRNLDCRAVARTVGWHRCSRGAPERRAEWLRIGAKDVGATARFYQFAFGLHEVQRIQTPQFLEIMLDSAPPLMPRKPMQVPTS